MSSNRKGVARGALDTQVLSQRETRPLIQEWQAERSRHTYPAPVNAGEEQQPTVVPPTWRWARLLREQRHPAGGLRRADVPAAPGVYVWFRDGQPVYAGRALGRLKGRISTHLGRDLDLSRSSLRRNVADVLLAVPTSVSRHRPSIMEPVQVDRVNAWISDLEVAWLVLTDAQEARSFESHILTEWKPPLNRR